MGVFLQRLGILGQGAAGGDPYWNNVVLLIGAEGFNNAVYTVDESPQRHLLANVGNAKIITSQQKYGNSCLTLDGNGDYVYAQEHNDFDMGSGDFTIEFWTRMSGEPSIWKDWLAKYDTSSSNRQYQIQYENGANKIQCHISTNGVNYLEASFDLDTDGIGVAGFFNNAWHHIAVVRYNGTNKVYVDGLEGAISWVGGGTALFANTGIDLTIGGRRNGTGIAGAIDAEMDEIRITKGVGRYTGPFSVPTEAFPRGYVDPPNWPAMGIPWANIVLQVPSGADASTTFLDQSTSFGTHTMTQSGAVAHTDADAPPLVGETTCIDFPGTGYFQSDDHDDFDFGSGNYGMDCWIKTTSGGELITKYNFTAARAFRFHVSGGFLVFQQFGDKNSTTQYDTSVTGTTPVADDEWHHVALVHIAGQTSRLFVDGILEKVAGNSWGGNWPIDATPSAVRFGQTENEVGNWTGKMAWPRLWRDYAGPTQNFALPTEIPATS